MRVSVYLESCTDWLTTSALIVAPGQFLAIILSSRQLMCQRLLWVLQAYNCCDAVQPLDEPLVLGILYQCAAGVRHLHTAAKLVHRDIRADNFLVASLVPLRMLITDFGLSHQMTDAAGTSASTSFTLIGPVGMQRAYLHS